MFLIGITLLATMPVQQTYWSQFFVATVIMPWGMDMSFPAATLILSNAVEKRHQGVAASLINTIVNYSISLGLGFAGTVAANVGDGGTQVLESYRGAEYFGIGVSALGLGVSLAFLGKSYLREWKEAKHDGR